MADLSLCIECDECRKIFRVPPDAPAGEMIICRRCGKKHSQASAAMLQPPGKEPFNWKDNRHKITAAVGYTGEGMDLNVLDYDEAIRPGVESFIRNMGRAYSAVFLPVFLTGHAAMHTMLEQVTKHHNADSKEVEQDFEKKYDPLRRTRFLGQCYIDTIIASQTQYGVISDAVDTMLATQIIAAWTALESLAADLWVQCLNARPKLGLIAIGAEPLAEDDADTLEKKRRTPIPVPVEMLDIKDFDLRKKMGDLLSRMKKWDFARRSGAIKAYEVVFGKDSVIPASLNTTETRWLAALRNTLVHNAGKANREFTLAVSTHPTLGKTEEGGIVLLDGELASEMFRIADEAGVRLIKDVANWLAQNPT